MEVMEKRSKSEQVTFCLYSRRVHLVLSDFFDTSGWFEWYVTRPVVGRAWAPAFSFRRPPVHMAGSTIVRG